MNDIEDRLTQLMKGAVGDPPQRVTVQSVRRRRARRRAAAGAAAIAVAALAVISAGLALRPGGPGPAGGPALPRGVPRYYAVETYNFSHRRFTTVLRATATGAVTATVRCPQPVARPQIYPMTADSQHQFFAVCTQLPPPFTNTLPSHRYVFEFQVTRAGRVRGYALVPGGQLGTSGIWQLAVSPDGSEVAVVVSPPGTSPSAVTTAQAQILVINTRTGARAVWRNPPASPHAVRFRIDSASVTDGRELVFLGTQTCGPGGNPAPCQPRVQQVRELGPAGNGGLLTSGRVLLQKIIRGRAAPIGQAVPSSDGTTLTIVTAPVTAPRSTTTVTQINIRTRRQHIIYRATNRHYANENLFSPDPSGRYYLIIRFGPSSRVIGWINHGKLTKLKPASKSIYYGAW